MLPVFHKVNISYPGNKGVKTLIPHIINIIPPHKRYVELFLGSGGVARNLRIGAHAVGIEYSRLVINKFKNDYPAGMVVVKGCAISWLRHHLPCSADTFIYADPPYLKKSRRSTVDIYDHEISQSDHVQLLKLLSSTLAMVAISGYDSSLYREMLKGWNCIRLPVCVHGHVQEEVVWFNYPHPSKLHQYNFAGKNKTERQRIKRKIERWQNRLNNLPPVERNAILSHFESKR